MFMYLRFITFETMTDFKRQQANGTTGSPSEQLMKHQQTMHFVHLRTLVFILRTGRTARNARRHTCLRPVNLPLLEPRLSCIILSAALVLGTVTVGGSLPITSFFFQRLIVIDKKQKQTKKKKKNTTLNRKMIEIIISIQRI